MGASQCAVLPISKPDSVPADWDPLKRFYRSDLYVTNASLLWTWQDLDCQ